MYRFLVLKWMQLTPYSSVTIPVMFLLHVTVLYHLVLFLHDHTSLLSVHIENICIMRYGRADACLKERSWKINENY